MSKRIETIVIGAGQAGLAASVHLTSRGREHVVVERGRVGETWRTSRWDGFYLNTPKWTQQLPGREYEGDEPDAFSSLEEIIGYLDAYAGSLSAPVRTDVEVTRLRPTGKGFEVVAGGEALQAENVVVATGAYQEPTPIPPSATRCDAFQLHTSAYRNPRELPEGAVLVVGGGQSGCQIADELLRAGRTVYLSFGRCAGIPRRYRGCEILRWLVDTGFMDHTVDTLPSPAARLSCNPPVSGNDGGHDCNPRWLQQHGAVLLGRLRDFDSQNAVLATDVEDTLAQSDALTADLLHMIDGHIARQGLDVPESEPPVTGSVPPAPEKLNLREAGISTILWSNGYRPSFGWIDAPLFDEDGWPVQERGVTACPGLYFVGMHWLHKRKSSLLFGVGEDAEHVVSHLDGRTGGR